MNITSRIDSITKIPQAYMTATPPCPRSVKIELTGICNFRCSFCAASDKLRKRGEMDMGFYKRLVKEMREAGVEELGVFFLGESFASKNLEEAIRYAKEDCGYPYIFLTTNGSLSTGPRVRDCMEAGLNSLKFSFNYADAKQLTEVANVKGHHFQTMIDNIKYAREIRDLWNHDCILSASYIQFDGEQGEKMLKAVEMIRPYVDEVYALPLYSQAGLVEQKEKEHGWKPTAGNMGRLDNMRDPLPCWALFTEGHVTFDGKLGACCFSFTEDFNMGNLNEMSFLDAWHSNKFQKLRAANLKKNVTGTACEVCAAY